MAMIGYNLCQSLAMIRRNPYYNNYTGDLRIIKSCSLSVNEEDQSKLAIRSSSSAQEIQRIATIKKRCLRCKALYSDQDNSATACSFHGHTTGEKGLFALAPPHQGIDGEWSDRSGVIVYRWNEKGNRPNTGMPNWKKRWSCCAEYSEDAPPCRRGCHVSYDDGYTLY